MMWRKEVGEMRSRITTGMLAGLIAAVPMGIAMRFINVSAPSGEQMSVLDLIVTAVGIGLPLFLILHFLIDAVIGACFGWWFGNRVRGAAGGIGWGALHGVLFWALRVLVLLPLAMGMPALATITRPEARSIAVGGLFIQLIFGVALGLAYVWLFPWPRAVPIERKHPTEEPGR
jgi:hypothetical protein